MTDWKNRDGWKKDGRRITERDALRLLVRAMHEGHKMTVNLRVSGAPWYVRALLRVRLRVLVWWLKVQARRARWRENKERRSRR